MIRKNSNKKIIFQIICLLLLIPLIVGCSGHIIEKQSVDPIISRGDMAMGAPAVDMTFADDEMDEGIAYSKTANPEPMITPMPPYPGDDGEAEIIDAYDRKVIKTASLTVEVQDYETASIKVMNLAQKYSGFVADSNSYTDKNGKKRGHVNIRIPSLHFDAALIEVGSFGEVKSQTINGQDITENYMNTKARLNNSQREEQRLLEVLNKANKVEDILRIEKELSRVRYDIESAQGRLNYLDNHVSYSTLSVELYEPVPVVKEYGIVTAFKDAVNYCLATLRFLIRAIGLVLPVILLGIIVVVVILLAKKKKRRK